MSSTANSSTIKIGLDVSGGDFAPESNVLGAIKAQKEFDSSIKIVLIGNQSAILRILEREGVNPSLFEIVNATQVIEMGEHPTKAYTKKTDSSVVIGFSLLKKKKIDVFASTGNTGAMLVGAVLTIRSVSGVIRPCITSIIPKESGGVNVILDVGINADCKADVLYQFGILGSLYAEHLYGIKNPKVGLLNIGEEEEKGNLLSQAAHDLMKGTSDFNFVGNVEGRDLFSDKTDVIVCDGYTGNIVLKEAEAVYSLIKKRGIKDDYFDRFNYELYGGSLLLGINSNVVIGHGISSPLAIKNMLHLSKEAVENKLSIKIKNAFS